MCTAKTIEVAHLVVQPRSNDPTQEPRNEVIGSHTKHRSYPEVLFKALTLSIGQYIIHIYTCICAVALTTP